MIKKENPCSDCFVVSFNICLLYIEFKIVFRLSLLIKLLSIKTISIVDRMYVNSPVCCLSIKLILKWRTLYITIEKFHVFLLINRDC